MTVYAILFVIVATIVSMFCPPDNKQKNKKPVARKKKQNNETVTISRSAYDKLMKKGH